MSGHCTTTIGAKVPNSGPLPQRLGIGEMAAELERAGFRSLWVSDHVVMPRTIESRYPFAADGRATWPSDTPYFDAVVSLAMIAAATSSARFGAAVLVLPQREPVVLAKQLASLDSLSGGRLEMGVGAGWLAEEFEALGVPFASRGSRMEEWIALLRACWTGSPPPHHGGHYVLPDGVLCLPAPPHPIPLLIGGHSKTAWRRAGALGDGWLAHQSAVALEPAEITRGVEAMRSAAESAGRDPLALRVVLRIIDSAGRAAEVGDALPALAQAGVDEIVIDVDWEASDGPAEALRALH